MEKMSGVIAKFRKRTVADQCPIALGMIKEVYADAIEYTGIPIGTRGMLTVFGLFNLSMMTLIAKELLFFRAGGIRFGLLDVIAALLASVALLFGVYLALRFVRLEYFRPIDEPVIFDRKYRKIYRISRESRPGVKGLLKRWPVKQTVYDWDLVEAEHHASVDANTANVSRIHALVFGVRASEADATIVDGFTLGSSVQMSELTVPAVWEHVRRFMEAGGPHLPPGEVTWPKKPAPTLRRSMASIAPWGKNLRTWWAHQRGWLIAAAIFCPIVFPLAFLLALFSWLSYKTSTPIEWSPDVCSAIGKHC